MLTKLKKIENVLLFLTLLFLPTQLGRHFWPDFSYIYSLKIDYLSPTIFFWDVPVSGLLLTWVLQRPKVNKTALNLLLFFLLTQAISLFGATNIEAGLVRLEQYIVAGFFGVYIASQDFSMLAKNIYLPLCLGVIGESLIAILQFLKGSTLGLWILGERSFSISTPGIAKFDFYGLEFLRPYGTFPHPNVLAGFMFLVLVILFIPVILSETKDLKIRNLEIFHLRFKMTIFNVAALLGGISILLTMSRTVILTGFVMLVILLRRRWRIFKSVNSKALLIIIFILILSPILFTRFSSLLSFDNLTLLRREELIENSLQMFLKQPFFGIGLNNFIPAAAGELLTGPSRFLQPVHNIFLLTLSETGLVGLVGFLVLVGYPILSSLRKQGSIPIIYLYRFRCRKTRLIWSGMAIPWLIVIFLGMFDHYFLTLPQGYRLLFLVWGLSFRMTTK